MFPKLLILASGTTPSLWLAFCFLKRYIAVQTNRFSIRAILNTASFALLWLPHAWVCPFPFEVFAWWVKGMEKVLPYIIDGFIRVFTESKYQNYPKMDLLLSKKNMELLAPLSLLPQARFGNRRSLERCKQLSYGQSIPPWQFMTSWLVCSWDFGSLTPRFLWKKSVASFQIFLDLQTSGTAFKFTRAKWKTSSQ